jgi:hypothetical protein
MALVYAIDVPFSSTLWHDACVERRVAACMFWPELHLPVRVSPFPQRQGAEVRAERVGRLFLSPTTEHIMVTLTSGPAPSRAICLARARSRPLEAFAYCVAATCNSAGTRRECQSVQSTCMSAEGGIEAFPCVVSADVHDRRGALKVVIQ